VILAKKINDILDRRTRTQSVAADLLGMPQPKISAIRNYKIRGISLERLMQALTALGRRDRRHARKEEIRRADCRRGLRQRPRVCGLGDRHAAPGMHTSAALTDRRIRPLSSSPRRKPGSMAAAYCCITTGFRLSPE